MPICSAEDVISGNAIGSRFEVTVPIAKAKLPAKIMTMPGSFAVLASMPLPPIRAAIPAKAITSASIRRADIRSPRIGHANSDAHTGMV